LPGAGARVLVKLTPRADSPPTTGASLVRFRCPGAEPGDQLEADLLVDLDEERPGSLLDGAGLRTSCRSGRRLRQSLGRRGSDQRDKDDGADLLERMSIPA
jgi:hypothetical protein